MKLIHADNVNIALSEGLHYLSESGDRDESRNGPVLVAPGPVMTTYYNPRHRVLFSPKRDANPFFHFFESLWMLAGRNDLAWPLLFNSKFGGYSDDGSTIHGAYGYRWRRWFGKDQLTLLIQHLRDTPNSRRAVLSMWSPVGDLTSRPTHAGGLYGKDVPCNTHAYFDTRHGQLNMTVCNRSNDAIWGAYGANAVHFSMLQEYMAFALDLPVGVYRQFSNNLHTYTDIFPMADIQELAIDAALHDYYNRDRTLVAGGRLHDNPNDKVIDLYPLVRRSVTEWDANLHIFMRAPGCGHVYTEAFFADVASPMWDAFTHWKHARDYVGALEYASKIAAGDWRIACTEWLERRQLRAQEKKAAPETLSLTGNMVVITKEELRGN